MPTLDNPRSLHNPIDMYTIMVMMNVLTVVHGVGGDRGEPHGTDDELC